MIEFFVGTMQECISPDPLLRFDAQAHPRNPGVYLFKDAGGRIIYVGKAKNLRARLASYFRKPERLPSKTRAMVAKAAGLDVLCTTTEKEALLLESSLIKKHRPRYNICLRDDKQYVLFKLDAAADYPRLVLTRTVLKDGALYFGPFISFQAARQTLKAVHRLFPLRRCKEAVFRNRVRPCLYHHIGHCLAPCVLEVSRDDYADMVRRVRLFLAGKSRELTANLKSAMQEHADRLEYEKAAEVRDLLRGISQTLERQAAVLRDELDRDVLGFVQSKKGLGVSVLFVRQGRLLDSKHFFWPRADQDVQTLAENERIALETSEDFQEVLDSFLVQFYGPEQFIPERVVLPLSLKNTVVAEVLEERRGAPVRLEPARGFEEKQLVDMARANAVQALRHNKPDVLRILGKALDLPQAPARIEAVDVSHLAGQGVVVGMVVFEDGKPLQSAFRIHAFPELKGCCDDYLALASWAKRRARSGPPWPDLLLVDGGLGQLGVVSRALKEAGVDPPWPLAGIAKAGRRAGELDDKIFRPGRKNSLPLKPGSPELLFLQRLRDTVHRFAVSRQRKSRKKTALDSRLLNITGIGPKTAKLLWEHFANIEAMRQASAQDLAALPGMGPNRAVKLQNALRELTWGREVSRPSCSG